MKLLNSLNLGAIAVIVCLLLARYLPAVAQRSFRPEAPMENWSTLTLRDPSLGGRPLGNSAMIKAALLLVVGDCGHCNETKVQGLASYSVGKSFRKIVLVAASDTIENVRTEFGSAAGVSLGLLTKSQSAALNASFLPRVYAFDASGRLLYIQSPSQSYSQGFIFGSEALAKGTL